MNVTISKNVGVPHDVNLRSCCKTSLLWVFFLCYAAQLYHYVRVQGPVGGGFSREERGEPACCGWQKVKEAIVQATANVLV